MRVAGINISVAEVTSGLRDIRDEIKGYGDAPETDVRLQAHDEDWSLHSGDASYDQDHRGYWGASSVSVNDTMKDLKAIAKDLIDQAADQAAMEGD